ncbi:phage coat protein [Photorhabdus temperata]|uniref:major coat protein n=1 Tax=Photorhabdus TaxID=29487 RepID=UPI001F624DB2|nr:MULTISPECIES: major coat protein [Photorhabdus]MCT8349542.1 phage coat protein [Photorhabdus temperata]
MKLTQSIIAKFVASSTLVVGTSAFAANEPTDYAKQAFDSLTTQASSLSGYAWGLAVLIVGATIGIKLFKKFVSRAS